MPRFRPEHHDDGEKTILGHRGRFGVEEVLDLAANHPATGRFLASKLIAFFGASDPAGSLQQRMAASFAEGGQEIRPMLETLLTSPEFSSGQSRASQVKSPVQLLVGACRQLRLDVEPTPSLAELTSAMGQELFNPPNVKGWPGAASWIGTGTLAVRYHLAEALVDGRLPDGLTPLGRDAAIPLPRDPQQRRERLQRIEGFDEERAAQRDHQGLIVRFDPGRLFPDGVPDHSKALVDMMVDRLLVLPMRSPARRALMDACRRSSPADRPATVARLILTSPEYQIA